MEGKKIIPARRVQDIKEYYFSRKLKEIDLMRKAGRDVISLGIGGPDRMPSEEVIAALEEDARRKDSHSYQPYTGLPDLRRAYSDWYRRKYGVDLNPDTEILPLIGSKEGVLHISLAFLNPGDGVLVPDPGYPTYSSVSRLVGAELFNYRLTENNGWQPDFDELEKLPLDKIKLMWVNYPHMPTGTQADYDVMKKIVEFGRRHGIVIAHDNPYSFILNPEPASILQIPGAREIAVELNSLSKSHNMAGWRMGMAASNPEFISWILKVKSNIDSGQFRPMMKAAVKALELPDEWYEEVNSHYRRRRRIAERIMDALGCAYDPKQVGLFVWGRIPEGEESSERFADRILEGADVFVTPGFIFGSEGERYIRISLCTTESRMEEALKRTLSLQNH